VELTVSYVSYATHSNRRNLTFVKLAVTFPLADGTADTELGTKLVVAATDTALPEAGAGVAEGAAEEEAPARTAAPTSGCFPDTGSVLSPQLDPAALRVLPYIRQML
jgi:hypothetical protein